MGARILKSIVDSMLTGGARVMPYDSIGALDSRLWDPEWSAKYGTRFTSLWRMLSYSLGDSTKAMTVASGESYWWGDRGGRPSVHLASFDNMTFTQVVNRINDWFERILGGQSLQDVLNAIGDPVPFPGRGRPPSRSPSRSHSRSRPASP